MRPRLLVACEFSGRVRDASARKGWDAMSCDLLPSETEGKHYQGDVRDVLDDGWDLMVAFPPCTHLSKAGARWWKDKQEEQAEAVASLSLGWTDEPGTSRYRAAGLVGRASAAPDSSRVSGAVLEGEARVSHSQAAQRASVLA